jgi:polysaccharide export outer membrane protein
MRRIRLRLLVEFGTALSLGAVGCQSAAQRPAEVAGPLAVFGAPVPLPERGDVPARAPSVCAWRAAAAAGARTGAVERATYQPTDDAGLPALVPEPRSPEKTEEKTKESPELPGPHLLAPGPIQAVPDPHAIASVPRELDKRPLPAYLIEPPDVLLIEVLAKEGLLKNDQPIRGQHLVRPDGTVGLGIYGSVYLGGLTLEEARDAVAAHLRALPGRNLNVQSRDVNVDVLAYNSKFYYVIADGGGYGEQVYAFPITGSETVLDALGRVNGLPAVADKKKVWVARRGPGPVGQILPVDWNGIAQHGGTATNYQLCPGDRVYVQSDHWIRTDAWIGKRLSPIDRILGSMLLGGEAVNSVRGRTGGSGGSQ